MVSILPLSLHRQYARGVVSWTVAVILAAAVGGAAAAQVPSPVDHTPITTAAQDATGTVWATTRTPQAGLLRWSGGGWARADVGMAGGGGAALGVWPGLNGSVLVLWISQGGYAIYSYRGNQSTPLARFNAPLHGVRLIATPPDNVWIVENSPTIYRVEDGRVRPVYTVTPEQFFTYTHWPPDRPTIYCPWQAASDGNGRTWFWSNSVSRFSNAAPMRGFVIYDGRTFTYHRSIDGLPEGGISFLGQARRGELLAGVLGHGLFSINARTLTAKRLGSNEPAALARVTEAFQTSSGVYAVTGPPLHGPSLSFETPGHAFSDELWRYRSGKWTKVMPGVDDIPVVARGLARPWLETKRGLWLGATASGLWFIPLRGVPRLLDWKQGLPLDTVNGLFELGPPGASRLLAIDLEGSRTAAFTAAALTARAPHEAGIHVINPFTAIMPDQHHHLWAIVTVGGDSLDEWDGAAWTHHPLPGNLTPTWLSGVDADSSGRIWLFPGCQLGPIAIFNPARQTWANYPSYQAALQAQNGAHIQFYNAGEDRMQPVYGPSGQIIFTGACRGINYFDGTRWHLYNRRDVPGESGFFFDSPAFFDSNGRLAVNIHHETWEVVPGTGWHMIPYQPGKRARVELFGPRPLSRPPAGCSANQWSSVATDRLGRSWWTEEGNLYVGIGGLCHRVLKSDEAQPFIDGRELRGVRVDARGNVFLETLIASNRVGEAVIYSPPGPAPSVSIGLIRLSPDSVRLNFSSTVRGPLLYSWRLDKGGWTTPEPKASAMLTALPSGEHTIEVTAFNSILNADPIPASATVDIRVNPEQQIAGLIEKLAHAANDDEREAAVGEIERQPPESALPALRLALKTASPTERWWIDAAIGALAQNPPAPTVRSEVAQ